MFNHRSLIWISLSSLGFALLLVLSFIYSIPRQELFVVHRQIDSVPPGFIRKGSADPQQTIKIVIGIASQNMSGLENRLYEVSDPKSPDYGKHLSKDQVKEFVSPNANVTERFNNWLASVGVTPTETSYAGHHVKLQLSVAQAGKLLNATFNEYENTSNNQTLIRTETYSVPASLWEDITYVHPTTSFPPPTSGGGSQSQSSASAPVTSKTTTRRSTTCDPNDFTIQCIMAHYNIPNNLGTTGSGTGSIAVISNLNGSVYGPDILQFISSNRPEFPPSEIRVDITSVDGGDILPPTQTRSATNIIAQVLLGLVPSSPMTVIASSEFDDVADQLSSMIDVLNMIIEEDNSPGVLIFPLNIPESDVPSEMLTAVCNSIMAVATLGTTFITSGADSSNCDSLSTFFPASCPYALSVAVSQLEVSSGSEISGGGTAGFSNFFSRPFYQSTAVKNYLDEIGPVNATINSTGRAYPDITTLGQPMPIFNVEETETSGALLSLAIVGAMIAGLNGQRMSQGKSTMGFINPLLYQNPGAMIDIIEGLSSCGDSGFPVTAGYDVVTGLGSPDYTKLLNLIN